MSQTLRYDLVIVGAGPAGATAAGAAAEQGIHTLIIEKKDCVGLPVQCAEHIPKLLTKQVNFQSRYIAQEVSRMMTYLPGGEVIETKAPGYIIDRSLFDKGLAIDAVGKGADLLMRTVALYRHEKGIMAGREGKEVTIEAKVIIGADGPISTVGKWIKRRNREFISALQGEVLLNEPIAATCIYFDLAYRGGYGWLFPKGRTANVGVGINSRLGRQRLAISFQHFLDKLQEEGKISDKRTLGYSAGFVPAGGYLDTSPWENILLVGDAAGQTDAITGAGIPQAIFCGRIAGETAAQAIKEKDLTILGEYEMKWQQLLGKSLRRAVEKRKLLAEHWHKESFNQILRKTWVAFDGYWRE